MGEVGGEVVDAVAQDARRRLLEVGRDPWLDAHEHAALRAEDNRQVVVLLKGLRVEGQGELVLRREERRFGLIWVSTCFPKKVQRFGGSTHEVILYQIQKQNTPPVLYYWVKNGVRYV